MKIFKKISIVLSFVLCLFLITGTSTFAQSNSANQSKSLVEKVKNVNFDQDFLEKVGFDPEEHVDSLGRAVENPEGKPNLSKKELQKRGQKISEYIIKLRNKNLTQEERYMKLYNKFDLIPYKNESESRTNPMSSNGDVTMHTPAAFYDNYAGSAYASADFIWNNTNYSVDCDYGYGDCGGDDAMGISFNKQIRRHSASLTLISSKGKFKTINSIAKSNFYGVVMKGQSKRSIIDGFNFYNGVVSIYFDKHESGGYLIDSKYAHTWDTTDIESLSISTGGIGVTFTKNSHKWTKSPQSNGSF